jgi:hypothetical protein
LQGIIACAGLDVHRLVSAAGGRVTKEVKSFAAIASGLAELVAWLSGFGVTHVGIEGTGVYWMAVSAALKRVSGITYFRAKYYSLKTRIGGCKAALAIGHKLLIRIWHMLSDGCFYRDLGEACLDRRNQQQVLKCSARKPDALGFAIVPKQQPVASAA